MTTTAIDPRDLAAAVAGVPSGTPLTMVNLLRFTAVATYPEGSEHAGSPAVSGREAYMSRYVPAFELVAGRFGGGRLHFAGAVAARLVGPEQEGWDAVALVDYADIASFRRIVEDPQYLQQAESHRIAALQDWRLLATTTLS